MGGGGFTEKNAMPEHGWSLQTARKSRGLERRLWMPTAGLDRGSQLAARGKIRWLGRRKISSEALSAARRLRCRVRARTQRLAGGEYAAAGDPQRAAWILRDGFISYLHFIDRPIEAARSFEEARR